MLKKAVHRLKNPLIILVTLVIMVGVLPMEFFASAALLNVNSGEVASDVTDCLDAQQLEEPDSSSGSGLGVQTSEKMMGKPGKVSEEVSWHQSFKRPDIVQPNKSNDENEPGKQQEYGEILAAANLTSVLFGNSAELKEIELSTPPDKLTYYSGEAFDTTGMKVTAIYDNGEKKDVTGDITGKWEVDKSGMFPWDDYLFEKESGSLNGMITYVENGIARSVFFSYVVNPARELEEIEITTKPANLVYIEGESLDLSGMVVTASYDNNTSEEVKAAKYTVTPADGALLNVPGTQKITVSYTYKTVTKTDSFEVTVKAAVSTPAVLTGITVETKPTKLVYTEGDTLDLSGMVVRAQYDDGTSKEITGYDVNPADGAALNTTGTQVITVSYEEDGITKTDSFEVTVKAAVSTPAVLTGITVETKPSKLVYTEGDALDLSGMVVRAQYDDGTSKEITGYDVNPADGAALNTTGTQVITVSYEEDGVTKTDSFEVTVNAAVSTPAVLTGITVETKPSKLVYTEGDTLDLSGMVVRAQYDDGTSKEITGYDANPADGAALNTTGTQVITVSYEEDGITKTDSFEVTVKAAVSTPAVLTGITVETKPSKLVYTEGDTLDLVGMVVRAQYDDGTSKEITGYDVNPKTLNTTGTQVITVSYEEGSVTKTDSFEVTVNAAVSTPAVLTGITVETKPSKLVYTEGDALDLSGMVVTAIYDDGTLIVVTDYIVNPANGTVLSATGEQTVTVTYTDANGKTVTATFTIMVNAANNNNGNNNNGSNTGGGGGNIVVGSTGGTPNGIDYTAGAITTTTVIDENDVPLAGGTVTLEDMEVPQTGGFPIELLGLVGGVIIAIGILFRRKKTV